MEGDQIIPQEGLGPGLGGNQQREGLVGEGAGTGEPRHVVGQGPPVGAEPGASRPGSHGTLPGNTPFPSPHPSEPDSENVSQQGRKFSDPEAQGLAYRQEVEGDQQAPQEFAGTGAFPKRLVTTGDEAVGAPSLLVGGAQALAQQQQPDQKKELLNLAAQMAGLGVIQRSHSPPVLDQAFYLNPAPLPPIGGQQPAVGTLNTSGLPSATHSGYPAGFAQLGGGSQRPPLTLPGAEPPTPQRPLNPRIMGSHRGLFRGPLGGRYVLPQSFPGRGGGGSPLGGGGSGSGGGPPRRPAGGGPPGGPPGGGPSAPPGLGPGLPTGQPLVRHVPEGESTVADIGKFDFTIKPDHQKALGYATSLITKMFKSIGWFASDPNLALHPDDRHYYATLSRNGLEGANALTQYCDTAITADETIRGGAIMTELWPTPEAKERARLDPVNYGFNTVLPMPKDVRLFDFPPEKEMNKEERAIKCAAFLIKVMKVSEEYYLSEELVIRLLLRHSVGDAYTLMVECIKYCGFCLHSVVTRYEKHYMDVLEVPLAEDECRKIRRKAKESVYDLAQRIIYRVNMAKREEKDPILRRRLTEASAKEILSRCVEIQIQRAAYQNEKTQIMQGRGFFSFHDLTDEYARLERERASDKELHRPREGEGRKHRGRKFAYLAEELMQGDPVAEQNESSGHEESSEEMSQSESESESEGEFDSFVALLRSKLKKQKKFKGKRNFSRSRPKRKFRKSHVRIAHDAASKDDSEKNDSAVTDDIPLGDGMVYLSEGIIQVTLPNSTTYQVDVRTLNCGPDQCYRCGGKFHKMNDGTCPMKGPLTKVCPICRTGGHSAAQCMRRKIPSAGLVTGKKKNSKN